MFESFARARGAEFALAITSRIREDVPNLPLSAQLNDLPTLGVDETGSVFRWDVSAWDDGDMWGDDEFVSASEELTQALIRQNKVPPDWRDWDHLHAHYLMRRHVFLTWDRRVLQLAGDLSDRLSLVVVTPEEFLKGRRS